MFQPPDNFKAIEVGVFDMDEWDSPTSFLGSKGRLNCVVA
jgi:hypothetical protein